MTFLPKIYSITDKRLSGISNLEQCKRLIEGGSKFIQIRDKTARSDEFFESAKRITALASEHNVTIIVNDRVDIALTVGTDGVHLGQDDLPVSKARQILGNDAIIGLSTHTVQQAIAALDQPIDYLAIGPVFATNTKQNPDKVVGLEGVRRVRDVIGDFPLAAIGGINRENLEDILDAGADSVAIVSGILSKPDEISSKFRSLD